MNEERKDTSQKSFDEFWEPDTILPRKKPMFSAANPDVGTVEIDVAGTAEENRPAVDENVRRIAEQRPIVAEEKIPQRLPANGKQRHLPADVRPMMSEPVCEYVPDNSLLLSVGVWRWPAKYHFFDRFHADALRYFDRSEPLCDYVPFYAYVPQYHMMNPDQLRYYLFFRSEVRRGRYPRTDYSYLFLYLYEIINLPEKIKPGEGLRAMTALWLAYREAFPRLDRYLGEWVCDYCLCNKLPMPYETLRPVLGELFDKVSLKEFYIRVEKDGGSPFSASLCDALTDYDWRTSKFVTPQTRQAFTEHYYAAILYALNEVWRGESDFAELLGLSEITQTRDAYAGAICTHNVKRRVDIRLLSVSRSYQFRTLLTLLCKFCENAIRAHFGIKARLSCVGLDERLRDAARRYFDTHLPPLSKLKQAENAARKERIKNGDEPAPEYAKYYEADHAALSKEDALRIEASSWQTTELLTKDGETEPDTASEPVPASAAESVNSTAQSDPFDPFDGDGTPYERFVDGLSAAEYEALKHIINGEKEAFEVVCARLLLLPQAMAERLNDRAVRLIEDTAVEEDADFYHLSDFYANEITDAVIRREERGDA